jgi:hypothetical protein
MPELYIDQGGTFHGYVLAPLLKFRAAVNKSYRLVGKVCCGYFDASGWDAQGIAYKAPDKAVENAATGGIFTSTSGGSSGGSFSLVG